MACSKQMISGCGSAPSAQAVRELVVSLGVGLGDPREQLIFLSRARAIGQVLHAFLKALVRTDPSELLDSFRRRFSCAGLPVGEVGHGEVASGRRRESAGPVSDWPTRTHPVAELSSHLDLELLTGKAGADTSVVV